MHDVGHLRRRNDGEITQAVIPPSNDAASLHRQHALARGANFASDLDGRSGGHGLDSGVGHESDENVVIPVIMNKRRRRLARLQHVDDGRQLFEFELDGSRDVFRLGPRATDARGDDLANEAHLAGCQDRLARVL